MDVHFFGETFVVAFATFAIGLSVAVLAIKLTRYGLNYLLLPSEMTARAEAVYPPDRQSFLAGMWALNVHPFRLWWQGNPITFIGHTLYHAGLFTAVGVYSMVALLATTRLPYTSLPERLITVCDWYGHREAIFTGSWLPQMAGVMAEKIFLVALVSACIGISTPFVMSLLKKRGAIRPLDSVMAAAGVEKIKGLSTHGSAMGYQRKAIGLLVLVMDYLMLITFLFPMSAVYTCAIHLTFAFTVMALMPLSFLFHEIYRIRMLNGVRRAMDGRFA